MSADTKRPSQLTEHSRGECDTNRLQTSKPVFDVQRCRNDEYTDAVYNINIHFY